MSTLPPGTPQPSDDDMRRIISRLLTPPHSPHQPQPKQGQFLLDMSLEALYGGAAGGGKALSLSAVLPTSSGLTTMGKVQVGDRLLSPSGHPCTVVAVTPVMYDRPCYRLTFSDESTLIADAEHLHPVEILSPHGDWIPGNHTSHALTECLTTATGRRRVRLAVNEPVVLPHADLPVDPYVFGAWLGDGDTRRGYLTIHHDDEQILDRVREAGFPCIRRERYHVRVDGLSEALRQGGILGTYRAPRPKRIPMAYRRASLDQRLALLQGIVDTDGHVDTRGQVEITWVSHDLVLDLLDLLGTLGVKATSRESAAMLNGCEVSRRWRVKFVTTLPVAFLDRKRERLSLAKHRPTTRYRYLDAVEEVESEPVRCVQVTGGLYLAENYLPTHNSDALLMAALQFVTVPGYSALLLRKSFADLSMPGALMERCDGWLRGSPARWNEMTHTWTFPSGATITFGYLQNVNDRLKYQGAEFQFCVAKGTPIRMGDGTWKPIDQITVGEHVATLEGPRPVLRTHHIGVKPVVRLTSRYGSSVVSRTHPILTPSGWVSPQVLMSTRSLLADSTLAECSPTSPSAALRLAHSWSGQRPVFAPAPLPRPGMRLLATSSSLAGAGSGSAGSGGSLPASPPPGEWSFLAGLYGPAPRSVEQPSPGCGGRCGWPECGVRGCSSGCQPCSRCGDAPPPPRSAADPASPPSPAGAGACSGQPVDGDGRGCTRGRSRPGPATYPHPYTTEVRAASEAYHWDAVSATPVGEAELFDLTVAGASHYVAWGEFTIRNCGFDELTQFKEADYRYLFSRVRRPKDDRLALSRVPLRIRGATNPGGPGHSWVYNRFVAPWEEARKQGIAPKRAFYPATVYDNKYLDTDEYLTSLAELDPVTRAQLEAGNWNIRPEGRMFKREWFETVDSAPQDVKWVRYWDLAATEKNPANDPDYTAGGLIGWSASERCFYLGHMIHMRGTPLDVEKIVKQTSYNDRSKYGHVPIYMEQEPGASGKSIISYYRNTILVPFEFNRDLPSGDKMTRAQIVANKAQAGMLKLVRGAWNEEYLDEVEIAPDGEHDDMLDVTSGGMHRLIARYGLFAPVGPGSITKISTWSMAV